MVPLPQAPCRRQLGKDRARWAPISSGLTKMPSDRLSRRRSRLVLRIDGGGAEIIPSIASTSKAGAGDLAVALSRVQRVEIGEAVNTEHDGLATDEELPDPVLQRGLSNPVKRLARQ
jgi:hypothetical protein